MGRHSLLRVHPLFVILIILVSIINEGISWLPTVTAFSSSDHRYERLNCRRSHFHQQQTPQSLSSSKLIQKRRDRIPQTALALGDDWWNSFKGLFEGLTNGLNNSNNDDGQSDEYADDEIAAGTSLIASIPGKVFACSCCVWRAIYAFINICISFLTFGCHPT